MGLPEVLINFQSKSGSAIERSGRGIVALVLEDEISTVDFVELEGIEDVNQAEWNETNYDLISLAFKGTPNKVIVQVIDTTVTTPETTLDALEKLKNKQFDYLATPYALDTEKTNVASFITGQRSNKKTFKAVLASEAAGNEGVINFTTDQIETENKTYTNAEYTVRIAGVLAGLPLTRSATYFVLDEVTSVLEHADPDTAIDNGELILINDGEKVKIARGVNSLTETTPEKDEQFTKITVIEKLDMLQSDIRSTFNDDYVGKMVNTYDNKMLFFSAVNAYFSRLVREGVLDDAGENKVGIDFASQKNYLQGKGVNVSELKTQEILEYSTGSNVFATASVRVTDGLEDLVFNIAV